MPDVPPKKSPAFQFYPSDFLGSPKVRVMDTREIGIYTLLLCLDWELGGFTLEEAEEHVVAHRTTLEQFTESWRKVSRCFGERNGRFFNPRLQEERAKQREWRRKSSKGGKLSAQKRLKGGSKVVEPPPQPTGNTLSPSPTPLTTTTPPPSDAVFEEAWAIYPKRPGNSRADTLKQWHARVKDGVDPLDMLAGARRYAKYVEVEGTEPRYVKQAQTFFGRGRHFEADWTPTRPSDPLSDRIAQLQAEEDAALEKTRQLLATRGAA